MPLVLGLFAAVAVAIVGAWSWLGSPVAMPPSPLAAGEKLYCVSYAPFRGEQNPLSAGTRIAAAQIEDDLIRLAKVTDCVRTYSIDHGLDQIAGIAARHGLKVMQGLWLSSDAVKNRKEIETTVALARQYPGVIRAVIVGNEVLLRGEMAAVELAATIREVKSRVPMAVTYADVWEFWLRHRDVYDAVDFVTIHILPYWEDLPIPAQDSGSHVDSIRARVAAVFPNKEILIGETGWPSAGRMREGALPSPANQARVLHDVLHAAKRGSYHVNVIEAFDQPWKRALEGTVGGHWGLFDDGTRTAKFAWGEPVSNHPHWQLQAGAGVALAALVFAAAWFAGRQRKNERAALWLAVACCALVPGTLVGWAIENIPLESLGAGGWIRSLVMAALAIAAPVLAAVALMRDSAVPSFAQVLGSSRDRPADPIAVALGIVLAILCTVALQVALGLVFDPRYKDFPFAPLTAATLPFLVLSLLPRASAPAARRAELIAAGVLALSAAYIALNESIANWQALWFSAVLFALVIVLVRPAVGRNSAPAMPPPGRRG